MASRVGSSRENGILGSFVTVAGAERRPGSDVGALWTVAQSLGVDLQVPSAASVTIGRFKQFEDDGDTKGSPRGDCLIDRSNVPDQRIGYEPCEDGTFARWQLTGDVAPGCNYWTGEIKNVRTQMCLDIDLFPADDPGFVPPRDITDDGDAIIKGTIKTSSCNGSREQRWKIWLERLHEVDWKLWPKNWRVIAWDPEPESERVSYRDEILNNPIYYDDVKSYCSKEWEDDAKNIRLDTIIAGAEEKNLVLYGRARTRWELQGFNWEAVDRPDGYPSCGPLWNQLFGPSQINFCEFYNFPNVTRKIERKWH
ncbi:hypothetical protein H072_9459 [Dactylellina haptotyla CBS 200.50]|uniref:Uncharacterized protein n=1 Tax=Dactylellina haptotyla (strain CBS 200.50) TaxID=1284197 RepID=S8BP46_DACHA|nr:hypothetical protein H072_9459 [Dactylellina haptotyla CBS 200.50]